MPSFYAKVDCEIYVLPTLPPRRSVPLLDPFLLCSSGTQRPSRLFYLTGGGRSLQPQTKEPKQNQWLDIGAALSSKISTSCFMVAIHVRAYDSRISQESEHRPRVEVDVRCT